MRRILTLLFPIILFSSCSKDKIYVETRLDQLLINSITQSSATGDLSHFILPESDNFAAIPQDPQNPLTAEKVALGKMLFYETGIALDAKKASGMESYSCASCHIPSAGFRPGGIQGIADGGLGFGDNGEGRNKFPNYDETELDVQGIRALSLLNVAFVKNTLWNGQFGSTDANEGTEALWDKKPETAVNSLGLAALESQNIVGQDLHRMLVSEEIITNLGYKDDYDKAFPDVPAYQRYSKRTTSFALSAYLRTLFTNQAPFQDWLKGEKSALTDEEKRGGILFFDKAKCASCHKGKSLNANNFYALGVNDLHEMGAFNTDADDKKNLGRGGFTQKAEDMYKFKVPQLYNLSDAPHFFHGSSRETIEDVVEYFNDAIPENDRVPASQISPIFQPLNLTAAEKADLVAFLSKSLNDPGLDRYVPEVTRSGNCFPNNDPFSRQDLGCN